MGVSIDMHVYDRRGLEHDIDVFVLKHGGYREGTVHPRAFLDKVGAQFGILSHDRLIVLWNEYYEDYNAGTNFLRAVEKYYFPDADADEDGDTGLDFWSSAYNSFYPAEGPADALENAFPDEFGEDGEYYTEY